ncbi:MAG: hypothetical protein ACFCVE_10770, partial [Phycisphaerae bacterium]
FLDEDDQELDDDGDVRTVDLDEDGDEGNSFGEDLDSLSVVLSAIENRRVHRADTLHFFSRGTFKRQTGQASLSGTEPARLVSDLTKLSAFIWYGHVDKIDGGLQVFETSQPFAADWVLGRVALPVSERFSDPVDSRFVGSEISGERSVFITNQPSSGPDLAKAPPFGWGSEAAHSTSPDPTVTVGADIPYGPASGGTYRIQNSVVDMVVAVLTPGETDSFYDRLVFQTIANSGWWFPLALTQTDMSTLSPPAGGESERAFRFAYSPNGPSDTRLNNTDANDKPIIEAIARTTPLLADGATKFIVEFAGDFDTTTPGLDLDADGAVQWYGLPRQPLYASDGSFTRYKVDTVAVLVGTRQSFERELPDDPGVNGERYICVWGPGDLTDANTGTNFIPARPPSMLRITVELVDPRGKMNEPMRQEFIYRLNP